MKRTAIQVLSFCALLMISSCGEGSEGPVAENKTGSSGTNRRTATPSRDAPPLNRSTAPNGSNSTSPNNTAENPLTAARNRKIEAMRQSGGDPAAAKADVESLLEQSTRPAPENSEFAVALTDIVVERRTFLKHPVLATVEKITEGTRSRIKLETTDGRTIDLPGSAIRNLSVASSASILNAAGLDMPHEQPSDKKRVTANAN